MQCTHAAGVAHSLYKDASCISQFNTGEQEVLVSFKMYSIAHATFKSIGEIGTISQSVMT